MGNIAYEKSFAFALAMVALSKGLRGAGEYELAKQLLRSGTSVGANIAESEYAQSADDFVSKLSIALKEAAESRYWLKLLTAAGDIAVDVSAGLVSQADEIIRILVASIKTAKRKPPAQ